MNRPMKKERQTGAARYQALLTLRSIEGLQAFVLDCFGDYLAKKEGYKEHEGIEAIWFYLVQKYHWLPAQVRALNWEDLHFLLDEEMHGWTVPPVARGLKPGWKTQP